eukprot:scaffold20390_cov59-Attheya_sp.AAC.1
MAPTGSSTGTAPSEPGIPDGSIWITTSVTCPMGTGLPTTTITFLAADNNYDNVPTPTTKNNNNNPFATLATEWEEDDDETVVTDNKSNETIGADTAFQAANINILIDQAVADAGATGNFMVPGAPVTNISPTKKPIVINLPDGSQIKSTHTCKIDNPDLPQEARHAHIVPGLAHTSLVSIKMLCDAGCTVTYDKNACNVYTTKIKSCGEE